MPDDLPGARGLAGLHTWNKSTPFRARQDSGRVFSSYLKTKMRQWIRNAVCLKKTMPLVTDGRSARARFDIISKHPLRGKSLALLQINRQPVEHGLVPKLAILRLQDPVALIREDQQLRWHALPLECGEHLQALSVGNA